MRPNKLLAPLAPAKLKAAAAPRPDAPALWAAYQQQRSAQNRNALWVHYQSLVKYIADRIKGKLPEYIQADELMSLGNVGLLQAIEAFDPARGFVFTTYAPPRIRGAILDGIRESDWVPRLERSLYSLCLHTSEVLRVGLQREPELDEIAAHAGISLKRAMRCFGNPFRKMVSLDDFATDRDTGRINIFFRDEAALDPARLAESRECSAIEFIPAGQGRDVCRLYYYESLSMKEIGKRLCISESGRSMPNRRPARS